uniref:Vitamin K epoxide reductase domain-containing protein n=1 Tax=Kalanchoe fedtschenkoi TaxID=63787 RepID=A0A7N0TUW3_KALFE
MASFVRLSPSPPSLCRSASRLSPPRIAPFKSGVGVRGVLLRIQCLQQDQKGADDVNAETSSSSSSSSASSSSVSAYRWSAGLGGLGLIETAYLSYLKLTQSDAFCPIGGQTCGDILNSDYAVVYGIPLPLIGMLAYGTVAILSLQLAVNIFPFKINENDGRFVLLGCTTAMASASAYFLYILSAKFTGVSCPYCLLSAFLSFSLFFTIIKDFGFQEIQKEVVLQLLLAVLVVFALNTSYSSLEPANKSMAKIEMKPFTTEITTESSPFALALAKHLHSIGAKMYGAFWCSHCVEQKQMFGREAAKLLDYVECFPDGYRTGIKIAKACSDVKIEGFPTWVINGQVLSGEQSFEELAQLSGFSPEEVNKSMDS